MPEVMPVNLSGKPLVLFAEEVEIAFLTACEKGTIRGVELRARLTQMICHWHRLTDAERALVLPHIRQHFPVH